MSFIKELVCSVHNVDLFDYEFVEIIWPGDCEEYLVIFKYAAKNEYIVYTLPYLVYQLALNCGDGGIAAEELAKEVGNAKNTIKYYRDLIDETTVKLDYYNQKICELKGED